MMSTSPSNNKPIEPNEPGLSHSSGGEDTGSSLMNSENAKARITKMFLPHNGIKLMEDFEQVLLNLVDEGIISE